MRCVHGSRAVAHAPWLTRRGSRAGLYVSRTTGQAPRGLIHCPARVAGVLVSWGAGVLGSWQKETPRNGGALSVDYADALQRAEYPVGISQTNLGTSSAGRSEIVKRFEAFEVSPYFPGVVQLAVAVEHFKSGPVRGVARTIARTSESVLCSVIDIVAANCPVIYARHYLTPALFPGVVAGHSIYGKKPRHTNKRNPAEN